MMQRILCLWFPGWASQQSVVARPEPKNQKLFSNLTEWCRQFSPIVGVCEPDGLLLDLTGLAHLFGDEPALTRTLLSRLAQRGLSARLAIADSLGAAWALAHYGEFCNDLNFTVEQ